VTGFAQGKKIHAIKGIRAATSMSLKDAKDIADAVEAGTPREIVLRDPDLRRELAEMGVVYNAVPVAFSLSDFVEALSRYNREMTVGTLADVLRATVTIEEATA